MAQTGYTPIYLYYSSTTTNQPSAGNLGYGELAINITDKNLFFKDNTNAVNVVPIRQSSGSSNGWLSSTDWTTFNSKAPALTYTTNYVPYGQGTTTPALSSSFTFDGTTLTSPAYTISSGNLAFGFTAQRITGDFSNSAQLNRLTFQTSVANASTSIGAIPSGSTNASSFIAYGLPDSGNSNFCAIVSTPNSESRILSGITGTGTYVPMTFYAGGSERARLFTSGGVSIGNTTDPGATNLSVTGSSSSASFIPTSSTIPDHGMYYPSTNVVGFAIGGAYRGGWYSTTSFLLGATGTGTTFSNAASVSNVCDLYQLGNHYYRNYSTTAGRYFWSGMDGGSSFFIYNDSNTGVYLAYGGTSWTANSDERLKTELTPFENALGKVNSLRAGTGRYLTDDESVSRSFLIAQDVKKVLPEAVNTQDDEQGTLGLQYTDVIPLLVAAIKELKQEFDQYKATHP